MQFLLFRRMRSMPSTKFFSGPPSNKATASTAAAAIATLFWTIAAHTFWKTVSTADLTLYISTSTIIVTAIVGFAIPESAAYSQHSSDRSAAAQQTAKSDTTAVSPVELTVQALEVKLQQVQIQLNALASRQGMALASRQGLTPTASIPSSGHPPAAGGPAAGESSLRTPVSVRKA